MKTPTADISQGHQDTVARGALSFIAVQLAFAVGGYAIHCYLGRRLGPVSYGDFGIAIGILAWLEVSLSGGFPYVIRRFGAQDPGLMPSIARAALRAQIVYSMLIFTAAMATAPLLASVMHDPKLTNLIRLACADIPVFGLYFSYMAILNGRQQFSHQAMAMTVYAAAKVAAVLLLVMVGLGVRGALIGNILASVGGAALAAFYSGRIPKAVPYPIRKLISYAGGTAALAVATSLIINLDLFMVKAIERSAVDTGFYTAAGTLARAPFMVFLAIPGAALPAIAKAAIRSDRALISRYVRQSLRLHMLLLMPATAIIASTAVGTIDLVYSSRYAPAGPSLATLAVAMMLFGFTNTLYNVMVAVGDTKSPLITSAALITIIAGLSLLLIPRMGMTGAATASLITSAIGLIVTCGLCGRRVGTSVVSIDSAVRISGAAAIVYGLGRMIPVQGAALLPFYVLLLAVYSTVLWLTRELTPDDVARLTDAVARKKNNAPC